MKHTFTDPDLIELDRIWPLGQLLQVPEHGVILVAGAYEGRYIHYLSEMFSMAAIEGFEPQREAFLCLQKRFSSNCRITTCNAGLSTADRKMELGKVDTDGASVLACSGAKYDVTMLDAVEVMQSFPPIDLFLMNMEGSEWAVIPYLLDEMMHHRIRSLAIQFHPEYVSMARAARVLAYLSEYYDNAGGDYPTWTYWQRRENDKSITIQRIQNHC